MELVNKFNHTFKMPQLSYKIFKIFLKVCENDWKQKNKNYIILIIYNQSNVITCLKCNAKHLYIFNKLYLCT
jgi:hypothetical protein